MKKLLIIAFMFLSTFIRAEIADDIAVAVKTGNAKSLAGYFNVNVELNMLGSEGVYSKAQAEQILRDFFSKNPPKNFSIIHQGSSKDGSRYAIGNLTAGTNTYRLYFYLKKAGESFHIKELRVENEK